MDRLEIIRRESERFAQVLSEADPEARVPTCPDWNAADLLWHLTEVHTFWSRVLGDNVVDDESAEALESNPPDRPQSMVQMALMRAEATEALLAQLGELDDDEPRWSWWPPEQTVGFTRRMQTYEATMHRVDAELIAGAAVSPIAPDVAVGAVDHCVDVMWGWLPPWATHKTLAFARFEAADTGGHWLVEVGHWSGTQPSTGKHLDYSRATRAPEGIRDIDVTVTGTAEQLARWAWGRAPVDSVTIEGAPEGVAAVRRLIEDGIQ